MAQHAQQLRAEDYAGGWREETAAFFGSPRYAPAERVERRLVLAELDREDRAEREHGRELPPVHGTAGAYRLCVDLDGRRCVACRSYQSTRVAANRAARAAASSCTASRSSYDAGCRCPGCSAANSGGCRRWREAVSWRNG